MLTQSKLKYLLEYDQQTGDFTWLVNKGSVPAGRKAGYLNHGYHRIMIDKQFYEAHRLAWLYMTGEFPEDQIDHINHIRNDNRWSNLRSATSSINCKNRSRGCNNKSGITGIYWHKNNSTWRTRIMHKGKDIDLGCFKDKFEAICARKSAEFKYGFHMNHGINLPDPSYRD